MENPERETYAIFREKGRKIFVDRLSILGPMIATIVSETPICIVGFLTLLITKGIFDWNLAILLSIGVLLGVL